MRPRLRRAAIRPAITGVPTITGVPAIMGMPIIMGMMVAVVTAVALASAGSAGPTGAGGALVKARKALATGHAGEAVSLLSKAINAKSLGTKKTTKALYFRGKAYGKVGKYAQAIADLTAALWLSGLTPAERADAYYVRALSYRAVGLGKRAISDLQSAKRLAPGNDAVNQALSGRRAGGGAGSRPVAGSSPPASTSTTASSMPPAPSSGSGSGSGGFVSGLTSFFGNLFSASSSSSPPAAAKSSPAKPAPVAAAPPVSWPATSSWLGTAKTHSRRARAPTPGGGVSAALRSAAPIVPGSTASGTVGRYLLQIATVRSEEEARTITAQLVTRHAKALGDVVPTIDSAPLGNMGTFYRVQLGPFADKGKTLRLCNRLRREGLDCFLVNR